MMLRPALRTSHTSRCHARVGDLDDAAGQPEVAHELAQARELRELRRVLVARELDEQDRVGLAADRLVHRRAERRDVARQLDHRAVDELDGRRARARRCAESRSIA